jgi:hypothetical protein
MLLQFRGDRACPRGPLNRALVWMRIRVFSCSLLSSGTRFVGGFNLYFPCIKMTVRELFCTRIWVFSCPLVSRAVSSLVLFYFSPYQRDVWNWIAQEFGYLLVLWRHLGTCCFLSGVILFSPPFSITFWETVLFLSLFISNLA